ncbi:MAG: 50S ribosomal protein L24 [bacterium]|nr:50S ribosomal protein L24 [bacterium]
MHVRKGDNVVVISGKDRGKKGKIIRTDPDSGRVVVEGVNVVKRHLKPQGKAIQGGIVDQEALLPSAKVMLVCVRCNRPSRLGRTRLKDGRQVRVCKKCKEVVDR